MKKPIAFILTAALTLPLLGCSQEGSTNPTAILESAISAQTEPTLPWLQEKSEALSYEEYFSTVRKYSLDGGEGNLSLDMSWGDYSISSGGGVLLITDVFGTVMHTVPNVDSDIHWIACDSIWVYGVRNGTELLRINYWGENEAVLYSDGLHSIGQEYTGHVYLGDNCTLFFAACSEQGSIICRLYLPDLTMDVLAESDSGTITLGDVLSNHEVTWSERNPEFLKLLNELSEEELAEYPPDDLWDRVSADCKVPHTIIHYENAATGESYTLFNYGNYYSERTQKNIEVNGNNWWNDFR